MTSLGKLGTAFSRFRIFRRDHHGVAAVEFAMILPVMLTIYLGSVEAGDGFAIDLKVTEVARDVADLATQYVTIDNSDMSSILNASAAIIAPYSAANIVVTVSEVTTDSAGNATVTWSDSLNGTARPVGQKIPLPTSLQMPNTSLILGEVSYNYAPSLGYALTGTIILSDDYFLSPRLSNSVTRVNS
jgi:Flp pilus assembly protein TadG